MAIKLDKNKRVEITDRTIPGINLQKRRISRLDIINFCWTLKELGVDLIEITPEAAKKMGRLPSGIDFLLRVESSEDYRHAGSGKIRRVIMGEGLFKELESHGELWESGLELTVEFRLRSLGELYAAAKNKAPAPDGRIQRIRITGLERCLSTHWTKLAERIRKNWGTAMEVCPLDGCYNATAVALEGMAAGMDCLALSFMGFGRFENHAPLEEVLTAARILMNADAGINLKVLPQLTEQFVRMTGVHIPKGKAIIGENIFSYESGIHADGIEKDPSTYEPFDPGLVGQKRSLAIGKHSGRKSVAKKFTDLGVDFKEEELPDILKSIREESIKLKRDLKDEEILKLFGRENASGL